LSLSGDSAGGGFRSSGEIAIGPRRNKGGAICGRPVVRSGGPAENLRSPPGNTFVLQQEHVGGKDQSSFRAKLRALMSGRRSQSGRVPGGVSGQCDWPRQESAIDLQSSGLGETVAWPCGCRTFGDRQPVCWLQAFVLCGRKRFDGFKVGARGCAWPQSKGLVGKLRFNDILA